MGCNSSKKSDAYNTAEGVASDSNAGKGSLVATARAPSCSTFANPHVGAVTSIASAGGSKFITGGDDKKLALVDWEGDNIVKTWEGHQRAVNKLVFGINSGLVVSCSRDLSVRKFSLESDAELGVMEGHTLNISGVALSEDERVLLTGARDTSLRLWDVETCEQTSMTKIPRNLVTCLRRVCGEQGHYVQGSEDLRLRTWDTRMGLSVPAQTIEGYIYFPLAVDVSADGNYYLTSSKGFNGVGCEGRIYDRRKGELLHTLTGHQQDATSCIYLPPVVGWSNPLAATASKDCTVRIWDTVSGECVCDYLEAESGMFTGLAALPQGNAADFCACTFTGNVYVYKVVDTETENPQLSCIAVGEPEQTYIVDESSI